MEYGSHAASWNAEAQLPHSKPVHAPQYHETLFSRVDPGKQESSPAYIPTLAVLETFLRLSPAQKQRTVLRSDAGCRKREARSRKRETR